MPPLASIAPVAVVCVLAFTIETVVGFGATLVTVSLGAFFLDIEPLLRALVPLNLALSAYLVVRYARHVDRAFLLRRLLPFMALGLPIGIGLARVLDASMLKRVLGLFLVAASVTELARRDAPRTALAPWSERALLVAGGAIHGAFATGGPMAVYVASRAIDDKDRYRATLSALWGVLNVLLLASYAWEGSLGVESGAWTLALVPSIGVGMVLGEVLHARVPAASFRTGVFVMLTIAGIALLVRG